MRRRPGNRDQMPIAEYFTMPDGRIPRFQATELFPFETADRKRYDRVHLETGSIIKLYDYQVGSRFLSFKGSRDALNENLVETILPFRLLDLRQKPDPKRGGDRALGVDARPFYGMEFLLLNSHREEDTDDEDLPAGEDRVFVGSFTDPNLGQVSISAIHLKREIPGWLKPQNSNNRVFHAVNGQVQYKQSRGYLSQSCGFPALKDRAIIIVDASGLSFSAHNEVWKGDREHISNTLDGERYLELVTKTIRESDALKQLQGKVAAEELERASKAESNNLFQKLVDKDPNLAGLLSSRDPTIRLPSSVGDNLGNAGDEEYEGKYSPTFIRLEERFQNAAIEIPLNRNRSISALTDAENGYLQRTDNPGHILLDPKIRECFSIREHLKDGVLLIYLTPVEDAVAPGTKISFRIGLRDEAMARPVETKELTIRIIDAQTEAESPKPNKTVATQRGTREDRNAQRNGSATHGLPRCVLLTRDGREISGYSVEKWPEGFAETDGGEITELGDEVIYKINYDNAYHLKYRLTQRGDIAREVVTEKYILGMRILLLGYEHAFRSVQKGKGSGGSTDGLAEFADDFRRMAARAAASTVLALAENLPKIIDASSVQAHDIE
jgi:hypothetical protein